VACVVYYCLFDKETAFVRPRQPKTALIQSADGVVPNRTSGRGEKYKFQSHLLEFMSAVCSRTNETHYLRVHGVSESIAMQAPHTRDMVTWPHKRLALSFTSSPLARRNVSPVASARRQSLNEARGPRPELDVEPRPPPAAALKDSQEECLYIESRFVPHTTRAYPWP